MTDPFAQTPAPEPMRYTPAPPSSGLAVGSLITALFGLGIVPVILGHMARKDIRQTGKSGDGLALAGLILGYIQVAFYTIILIFVLAGAAASTDSDGTRLDSLWGQCASGQLYACDQLYMESPLGSEEESFGMTCGGRSDTPGAWCSARGEAEFGE